MRLSKDQTEQNRRAIVDAASRLFRERGYDGVGLNELMNEAGFTHGGFYNHFASKEALAADVYRCTFAQKAAELARTLAGTTNEGACGPAPSGARKPGSASALGRMLTSFLSPEHRDAAADGCPSAALVADSARQGIDVQAAFAHGIEDYLSAFSAALEKPDPSLEEPAREDAERRSVAAALLSQIIGALLLSRAVGLASPELSDELLAAGRDAAVRLRTAPALRAPSKSPKKPRPTPTARAGRAQPRGRSSKGV